MQKVAFFIKEKLKITASAQLWVTLSALQAVSDVMEIWLDKGYRSRMS